MGKGGKGKTCAKKLRKIRIVPIMCINGCSFARNSSYYKLLV